LNFETNTQVISERNALLRILCLMSDDRDFMELLLSPASKVLNNWFEVMIYLSVLCVGKKFSAIQLYA